MNEEFKIVVLKSHRRPRVFLDEESAIHDKNCNVRKLPFRKRKLSSCTCGSEIEIRFKSTYFERRKDGK